MKLLQTRDKKPILANTLEQIKKEMLVRSIEEGIHFKHVNRFFWKSLKFITRCFPLFVGFYPLLFAGEISLTQIGMWVIIIFASLTPYAALHENEKRRNNYNQMQIAKFNNIRFEVIMNHFNSNYSDIAINRRLWPEEIWSYYILPLSYIPDNTWMNGLKNNSRVHQTYPGYILKTKNDIYLNAFNLLIQEDLFKHKKIKSSTLRKKCESIATLIIFVLLLIIRQKLETTLIIKFSPILIIKIIKLN